MRWYGRATFALSTLSVATCIWGSPTISDFEANAYYLTVLRTGLALERDRTGTFP